jgi:hypothetical protein
LIAKNDVETRVGFGLSGKSNVTVFVPDNTPSTTGVTTVKR